VLEVSFEVSSLFVTIAWSRFVIFNRKPAVWPTC
jgi:hypothetical protein